MFPSGRLNIYSKPDLLAFIQHVLRGTKELQYIKDSCFGKLFELPARQCPVSCKLIHAFLTRQLLCEDSQTLWSVFRINPIRFGLQEFGTITGLPCGDFPIDYNTELEDQSTAHKDPAWIKLIGKNKFTIIAELRHKLETDSRMSGWKRLRLALILIVDGILIAHQQTPRPTLKYFVAQKCEDPTSTLVQQLKQESFRLKGFPLALQLLAFQAVPQLQSLIPAPVDSLSIMQLEEPHLPVHSNISYLDILRVEADENVRTPSFLNLFISIKQRTHIQFRIISFQLTVTSLIPTDPVFGVPRDVIVDDQLTYMENLIANYYPFKKHLWPGGDTSEPILIYKPPRHQSVLNKQTSKKSINKQAPKQRKINNYFLRTCSTSNSNDHLIDLISNVSTEVSKLRKETKLLRKLIKRRKSRTHSKRYAFHSLIARPQKTATQQFSHKGYPPASNSPVVSQYAAQRYGKPSIHKTTENNSPIHKPPDHASRIHTLPEQSSPIHKSPVHNSPLHQSPDQATPFKTPHYATTSETTISPQPQYHSAIYDGPLPDVDCEELSDSSPAKPTPRHIPSLEECHLAAELFKCPFIPALTFIMPLPQLQWDIFYSTLQSNKQVLHITPSKFDFSNKFILDIAEPQKWVTTFHMEILMSMLAGRHRELLDREKLAFTTPYLASEIQEIFKKFKQLKSRDRFGWDTRITDLVLQPGKKWMGDVFTIYTPMIWGNKHWVGLAINLDMGLVEVLDPLPTLFLDKKVEKFMEPITVSLPYLVKKIAKPQQIQFCGLQPFHWKRINRLYNNERSGDCGSVSVKFLELHSHGDPAPHMSGITYRTVDDIRKQYAMDVYKTIVLPAYHAPMFP
ncbi:hypothetical protein N665_0553s0011 [Sinapis alba]|nr:hypothetical protein N665_0553s0011 [Sinapis alba]